MTTEAEIQHQAALDAQHTALTTLAKWNICAECNGLLVVIWDGQAMARQGEYQLRCGKDKSHRGMKSWRESPREKEREAQQMVVDNVGTEKGMALETFTGRTALTKVEAEVVLRTIWPKAPQAEIVKAALICQDYALNPLMKHLFLVPFNEGKANETWAVILSIHANRLLARRRGAYSYIDDTPRLMTEAEQIRRFGEVDGKNYWAITRLKGSQGNEAPGYGNWPKDKAAYGSDKGNTPQKMAFIRSERDALDRMFPGELPDLGVAEAQYVEAPRVVNGQTGEITEGQMPVPPEVASSLPPASPAKQPAPPSPVQERGTITPLAMPDFKSWEGFALFVSKKENGAVLTSAIAARCGHNFLGDMEFAPNLAQAWEAYLTLRVGKV